MASQPATIHVSNISLDTTEEQIREFFSYCGKINNLSITPVNEPEKTKSSTITFERVAAAKTALLLDNTELQHNKVKIEGAASLSELAEDTGASHEHGHDGLNQEDKPHTAILAEYLSHGYILAERVLKRGIEMDKKHGISERFRRYLISLDDKTKAHDTARSVNTAYDVTGKAQQGIDTIHRYLETALNTPTGHKVRKFYQDGEKQVLDIHNEALRLKELRKGNTLGGAGSAGGEKSGVVDVGEGKTKCSCAGNDGECKCAQGACACEGCQKKHEAAA